MITKNFLEQNMKNFYAPKGSKISINNGESEFSFDLYSDSGFELLSNLMLKVGAEKKLMYQANWLGRPIIQMPQDILALQEIIWKVEILLKEEIVLK